MKTLNIVFEDDDFQELKKQKGNTPWREFILNQVLQNNDNNE